jgi:hypothetical protein
MRKRTINFWIWYKNNDDKISDLGWRLIGWLETVVEWYRKVDYQLTWVTCICDELKTEQSDMDIVDYRSTIDGILMLD